jgi:16S rRNA (guanine(966)-N(2))-methyltransferase RsmD
MRIISGKHKGRTIKPPKFFKDRPTTDFAKEGLFSILTNWFDFEDIRVLDLFAGSGSITYEFASRGVKDITLVDKNGRYLSYIRQQLKELFPSGYNFNLIKDDVLRFIKERNLEYDVIFADPPYELPELEQLPDLIFENPTVPEDAIVIIEHSKAQDFSNHPYFFDHRNYGSVHFSFFSKKQD